MFTGAAGRRRRLLADRQAIYCCAAQQEGSRHVPPKHWQRTVLLLPRRHRGRTLPISWAAPIRSMRRLHGCHAGVAAAG